MDTDELAPENEGTQPTPESGPDDEAPGGEDAAALRERYENLRAEFNRTKNEHDEFQRRLRDPATQADLLAEYGFELADAEEPEGELAPSYDDDPIEALRAEVQELRAAREAEVGQAQAEAVEEAELSFINGQLDSLEERLGETMDQSLIDAVGDLSQVMRDDRGYPDVEAAYKRITDQIIGPARQKWLESKKAPRVPAGGSGGKAPDFSNERERQEYLAERFAQSEAGE